MPYGAIVAREDEGRRTFGGPVAESDRAAVEALCAKARLKPNDSLCFCTQTRASDVAAAILRGVHEPEALTLETGIRAACGLWCIPRDHLDLDLVSLPKATNRAVKLLVLNHAWALPGSSFRTTIAVGRHVGDALIRERRSPKGVIVADDLPRAMEIAVAESGTEKAIAFDGCYDAINVTRPLAEELVAKAPEVARQVDEELLPKWLRQRRLAA